MTRIELLLALLGLSLCAASMAAEPGLCKSMCTGEKRECRAQAKAETDLDREPLFESYDKNPVSRANSAGQVPTMEARAREQADTHRRVTERNGKCDTAYLRCVRACDAPANGGNDSVVIRRRQEAGAAGAPKP